MKQGRGQLQLLLPVLQAEPATESLPIAPTTTASSPAPVPKSAPAISRTRALVDAIRRHLPESRVLITDTRSVLLSQSESQGVRVVRVHQMFLDAPADVRDAVGLYLRRGDRCSGDVVDRFVEQRTHLLQWVARPLKEGAHVGVAHDLLAIFQTVNARYFENSIVAEIAWGSAGHARRRGRRSITFGSYDHRARRITMHPALDALRVPFLVVARIVHHEMLHAKHGDSRDPHGRRVVHGRAFRVEEATFDGAAVADAWLDAHLDELLRWRPSSPGERRALLSD